MNTQEWESCVHPKVGDTLTWNEPLWAAPNKPRGKRDKIGEQKITAQLLMSADVLELEVINVEKVSEGDAPLSVQASDKIKRKQSSLQKGDCHRLLAS